jgi:iron complex outermembrane receptor protein
MKRSIQRTLQRPCLRSTSSRTILGTLILSAWSASAIAQDVAGLSLEDLLNTDVSTVSRKTQRLSETAAAVFVITGEEIQRSGVTSIPEALRMVPGVQVARMGNARWAVTARGFNGRMANKLLVLMDGRSIYSPLFTGVLWEQEDTLLEDIDRIEVIRGPGAAMWGANAVNGVINIITKRARATQGGQVAIAGGSEDRAAGSARWGGEIDDQSHYRVWAKAIRRDASDDKLEIDPSHSARAGFRVDSTFGAGTRASIIGETYRVRAGDRYDRPDPSLATLGSGLISATQVTAKHSGTNLVGKLDTVLANGSEIGLQAYVETSTLDVPWAIVDDRDTADIDVQQRWHLGRHDVMWGIGYRYTRDHVAARTPNFVLDRRSRANSLLSAFIHDEWTLVPDRFRLIGGAKFERNDYTGWEVQPNVRFTWTPTETQTIWGALARAVRTPSQAEEDFSIQLRAVPPSAQVPLYNIVRAVSSARLDQAETVNSLEFGYRHQLMPSLSLDLAAYASRYRHLRSGKVLGTDMFFITTPFGAVPYLQTNIETVNRLEGRTHGFELAVDWHPSNDWRLLATYAYSRERVVDGPSGVSAADYAGKTPRHTASLRSSYNLSRDLQLDGWLRHVSRLDGVEIPAYTELDLRLAWRVAPALELSLVGQNLLDHRHPEWVGDYIPTPTLEIDRAWYVKAKLSF